MAANVGHGDAVVEKCQDLAARNYESSEILADMLKLSGLPKRSFDRRFRKATGYSPLEYVQWLRIEEAKQMLESDLTPIEDIAEEVGYSDLSSFRRLFRKLSGLTPGEYRRRFRLPENIEQELRVGTGAGKNLSQI